MKWEKFIQSGFRMPFYMNLFVEGKIKGVYEVTGWNHPCSLVVIENQINTVYESPEALKDYEKFITTHILEKTFRNKFIESFKKADLDLLNHCKNLYFTNYEKNSLSDFTKDLKIFGNLFRIKFGIYGLPKLTSEVIENILPKILSHPLSDDELAILTKPLVHSEYTIERINFLRIIKDIKDKKLTLTFEKTNEEIIDYLGRHYPKLYYKIETHSRLFSWLAISHHVQPMTLDHVIINLKGGLYDPIIEQELIDRENEIATTKIQQENLFERYKLNKSDQEILLFISHLNEINESRKVGMCKSVLWSYPFFQAIADVLEVDVISLRQLTIAELEKVIEYGKLTKEDVALINERLEYYVCLLREGVVINESGEKARQLTEQELGITEYSKVMELKGKIAQKGKVLAKVRLIISEHQINELIDGEVLVTSMTDPHMVPAMKRASAIVTDEGGITCHAAIMARELKIPCIIGTKIATKVLKDADLVEVDAEKGIVRILK